MNNSNIIQVASPLGRKVSIEIIESPETILSSGNAFKIVKTIQTIFGKMPMYALEDDEYLIQYTVDGYALKIQGIANLDALFFDESYSHIYLLRDKKTQSYYYSFYPDSHFISRMLLNKSHVLGEYTRTKSDPVTNYLMLTQALDFEEGSILLGLSLVRLRATENAFVDSALAESGGEKHSDWVF